MSFVADPTKKYAGTCQACLRNQSLNKKNGLVHHGYERPGSGYIVGDCAGVDHVPYELSCELSKSWAESLRGRIASWEAEHAGLALDITETIFWTNVLVSRVEKEGYHPIRSGKWGTSRWEKTVMFDVRRDHVPSRERGEQEATSYGAGHDFAYYRASRMGKLSGWISSAKYDLALLERRIAEWVYAPEKLTVYEGAKKAKVVHLENMGRVGSGRPACSFRVRNALVTADPAQVTCARCKK